MHSSQQNIAGDLPVTLTAEEILNPLTVLDEFFDFDRLERAIDILKQWRDTLITDAFFVNAKGNPSGLLSFHKNCIRLAEALFLLKDHEVQGPAEEIKSDDKRKAELDIAMAMLTAAEMQDVCAALREIFENRSLSSFRTSLYEWLEVGLSNQAANEFIPAAEMVPLYDTMQKLFVIAWLLNYGVIMLSGDKAHLISSSVNTPIERYRGNSITLYQVDKDISSYKDTVIQLVGMIKEKVSTIKAIFCLGKPPVPDAKIYLYILTPETEEQRAQNLVNKIEDICRPVHPVVALVHHQWHTNAGFDQDDLFVANAMNAALVYLSGDLILPVFPPLNRIAVADKATYKWSRWYKQGDDLLKGAEFYISCGVSSISLFSLQQAAEAYLIGIIKGVMGYKLNTHSLTRLLYITEMFTQNIKLVFADLDKELFDELRNAYLNVRFRDSLSGDIAKAEQLLPVIRTLGDVVNAVYQKHYLMNNI
ncbi:HEPN domain-containing protein [Mucilaginibacter conchicola]|uniref:HEPN domain-containing protein n=1 Tax=Mucilaginibacter conchicola TaxID=2303333 RepID=A0A372NML7_9SPHI|nr:HEPN domain-containing protein [Mucilaginibacter conchicola]RFZ89880.1 HEPN domain-containing protein [Mucilaginibacter conchicola]